MPNVPYSIDKSSFPSGEIISTTVLSEQISSAQGISVALDHIDTTESTVVIYFRAALSLDEEAVLNALILSYVNTPTAAIPMEVTWAGPKEDDGKLLISMTPHTIGLLTWFHGAGDSATLGRGEGQKMLLEWDGTEPLPSTKEIEIAYNEPIEIHDGQGTMTPRDSWDVTDNLDLYMYFPATTVTPAPLGDGDCNKIEVAPGYNMIVPAVGDGQYNIVVAVPTRARESAGHWTSSPFTGVISPKVGGSVNLYDFPNIAYFMKNMPLGQGVLDIDAKRTETIHPTHILKMRITRHSPGAAKFGFWVLGYRVYIS